MSLRPLIPAAAVAAALLGLSALDAIGVSQDGASQDGAADVPDVPRVEQTDEGAKPGQDVYPRRLPAGYGAVGLSREQKEKVYAIQAKYDDRIQELLDEIAAIKNKQTAEIAEVLTPGQREFLKRWETERDAQREADRRDAEAAARRNADDAIDPQGDPGQ